MRPTLWTIVIAIALSSTLPAAAQTDSTAIMDPKPVKKHWYELLSVKGYAQFRYNRLLETNDKFRYDPQDRSIGDNGE